MACTSLLRADVAPPRLQSRRRKRKRKSSKRRRTRLTIWCDTRPDLMARLMNPTLTTPADLLATRLLLLRDLAQSLEVSQIALTRNDAEMIARGAAHQAELCRQWSLLEDQLRRQSALPRSQETGSSAALSSSQHEREFEALTTRIRHLTRVHCSLLRHLQRSLTILACVVDRCSPTYSPSLSLLRADTRPQAGG